MEPRINKAFVVLLVIASVVSIATAIRCYECNSHDDKDCMNIDDESKAKFAKDCNSKNDGNRYTLCRKIDMQMDSDFGEAHPAENRIHRACGYLTSPEGDCYYKSGYNTRSWVCACHTDDCNKAGHLQFNIMVTLLMAGALQAAYRYYE